MKASAGVTDLVPPEQREEQEQPEQQQKQQSPEIFEEMDQDDDGDTVTEPQPPPPQGDNNNDAYITQLINRIVSLELEVSNQKQTISQINRSTPSPSSVSNGEIQSKPTKPRKPRTYIWTNERIEQKARWLFYHEHKKDNGILQAIYTRLAAAGVVYNVAVKVNGVMQEQPFLPWQYIKKTCDNMFNELPQVEKQNYIHQAVSMLN
jgi:hypothetical protein